jgi:Phage gp6-like head-tail connector protein
MADIIIRVLEPASSYELMSLDELKQMLGIDPTDTSEDAQLSAWIATYSDIIATMCNRVFAKEKVIETWSGDTPPFDCPRLFLSHWPVADDDIESIYANGVLIDPAGYILENRSGKLQVPVPANNSYFAEAVEVTYSGGYLLPDEAPPALKQALVLMVQAQRIQETRAVTSGIRSISHRESRVMFFDATQGTRSSGAGSSPIATAGDTVKSLLYHYMRFPV